MISKQDDRPNIALTSRRFNLFTTLVPPVHYKRVNPQDILSGTIPGFLPVAVQGTWQNLAPVLEKIKDWLPPVRAGAGWILLDNSLEGGPQSARQSEAWHRSFADAELSPSRFVYLTQDLPFGSKYNAWCDEHGIRERVAVINYHYHLKRFFEEFSEQGPALFRERLADFEQKTSVERSFVSLNFKPRPYRLVLLTRLLRDSFWEHGFISFGGLEQEALINKAVSWKRPDPVQAFHRLTISAASRQFLPQLLSKGEILIGDRPLVAGSQLVDARQLALDKNLDIYRRSWFSIISETDMAPFKSRITEKPMSAIANFHPIILFASLESLAIIRDLGFKTFDQWIDERYDTVSDSEARFELAYAEFVRFFAKAGATVQNDRSLRDVLAFNAEHALLTMPRRFRDHYDLRLAQKLAAIQHEAVRSASLHAV
jgi:hypothetical protein